jgi:small subunit ribosomal protein S9
MATVKAPKVTKKAAPKATKPAVKTAAAKSSNVQGYIAAVGRRKTSVARVRVSNGKGTITVNGRTFETYFPDIFWQRTVKEPLVLVGLDKQVDVSVLVRGGGVNSQAQAIRHGIARAAQQRDKALRTTLKKAGFLTRDPREKERKKYGLKRARRAPQFSKR